MNTIIETKPVVLVIGTIVKNGFYAEVREMHCADCRDLTRLRNDPMMKRTADFTEYASISECRNEYDIDSEEMGYWFDEDVKVLPCAS